jgi:plasmid stabilization system protein ParE
MQYRISQDAERDLEEIFVYWANRASLESADRIVDRIRAPATKPRAFVLPLAIRRTSPRVPSVRSTAFAF